VGPELVRRWGHKSPAQPALKGRPPGVDPGPTEIPQVRLAGAIPQETHSRNGTTRHTAALLLI
jgi:hypothetical protein